jgi:hypothetical protein
MNPAIHVIQGSDRLAAEDDNNGLAGQLSG